VHARYGRMKIIYRVVSNENLWVYVCNLHVTHNGDCQAGWNEINLNKYDWAFEKVGVNRQISKRDE
jgi:hypothetical protein